MRQILFSLLLLTLTQNAFAMEDDPRMGKVQTLKVHYSTFDTRSLDVQQKVLIYTLNYQQKLRREFKDLIYSTLERAPSKKEKLTPKTCLEFSDKIIPIDEISTNEMKSLVGHSINRILSYIFQMRVFSTARGKYPETRYNEALKGQRHLLLETIDKARTEAHNYNISLQYNLFHILEKSLKKDAVSFQFPHNKEMHNNKIKNSFKKFYAQESEIACIEDKTSIKQNELCNDKCFLQLFEAFSD